MYERRADANLVGVQSAFDRFINAPLNDRQSAFAGFSGAVFDYFSHRVESDAGRSLFSLDVPDRIQRFAAAWLLRAMTNSATALNFDDTERLTALLFDRTLQQDVYPAFEYRLGNPDV